MDDQPHRLESSRPRTDLTLAIAFVTVLAISIGSIGALLTARYNRSVAAASGTRLVSPSPQTSPSPSLQQPPPASIQVVAPTTDVVWALVDYSHLYRSTDQGNTWLQFSVPDQQGVRPMITFVDDREGWFLAPGSPTTECQEAKAALWNATDGGKLWHELAVTGIRSGQCKDGIWFIDAQHGFISAADPLHPPTIYRTSDGGSTWAASTLPDPPDFKSAPAGFELSVEWLKASGATLYLEAYGAQDSPIHDRHYIFTSTDGGATWRWLMKVASASVVMVTPSRWLDFSIPGQAMESINDGQQFHQFTSDLYPTSPSTQFVFADANVGYASGAGLVQRTIDGGAHWVRIPTPGFQPEMPSPSPAEIPMPSSAELSAPSTNVVWAFVANQYLFRSTDQGNTWQQRTRAPYPGGGGDALISFADDMTGWAAFPGVPATQCTFQGLQLWKTTDGALTWRSIAAVSDTQDSSTGISFAQCKESLFFTDSQHGFIGADDPTGDTIYRTADGGTTWSGAKLPAPPGFVSGAGRLPVVGIKAFGTTVLAYAPPHVFRSVDFGVTWSYVATEPGTPLGNLVFVGQSRWLALQNDQGALETLDAGKTWHGYATDYADAAPVRSMFVFADLEVGYGTARGDLHRTVDGGAHWEMIKNSWP
jgi:photosystem II stability/assembly factor-like uncharacterized protein